MNLRITVLALAGAAVAAGLAACGKQADLERPGPGPLSSVKARTEYAAQKRAQAAEATNEAAANSVAEPQNPAIQPYTDPAPAHDVPIPGERTYPSGSPQSGP